MELFDFDAAKKKMSNVLLRKKYEYKKSLCAFPDVNNTIIYIDKILDNDELLERATIIELTYDVADILYKFERNDKAQFPINDLLSACFSGKLSVISNFGLAIDFGNCGQSTLKPFGSSEELRMYLYELVGFQYQSKDVVNNETDEEVIDPMALNDFQSRHFLSFITDFSSFENFSVPKLVSKEKNK